MTAAAAASVGRAWPAILSPSMSVEHDLEAVTGDGKAITLSRASVRGTRRQPARQPVAAGCSAYGRPVAS
jgi:hypothetical protein